MNILKNMDNIFRNFLWNKKKAKIALNILKNPKDQGGLNLVDLNIKEKSMKATWPQILAKEPEYSEMVYRATHLSTIKENIWRCRLHPSDVDSLRISQQFWTDTIKSWCEYNYYTDFRVENQLIWYNSEIKIG